MMVEPDGKSGWYERIKPVMVINILSKMDMIIMRDTEPTNCAALAAGRINKAITRIRPTICINSTTVKAIIHNMRI